MHKIAARTGSQPTVNFCQVFIGFFRLKIETIVLLKAAREERSIWG